MRPDDDDARTAVQTLMDKLWDIDDDALHANKILVAYINQEEIEIDEYEQLEYDVNRCDDCDENHLCSDHAARRRDL